MNLSQFLDLNFFQKPPTGHQWNCNWFSTKHLSVQWFSLTGCTRWFCGTLHGTVPIIHMFLRKTRLHFCWTHLHCVHQFSWMRLVCRVSASVFPTKLAWTRPPKIQASSDLPQDASIWTHGRACRNSRMCPQLFLDASAVHGGRVLRFCWTRPQKFWTRLVTANQLIGVE